MALTHALRQAAEEFSATVADAGLLVERLKLLQEELSATVEEHTHHTLCILTLVTVMAQHGEGFFIIVCSLILVTGLLSYLLLLRRRDQSWIS